MESLDKGHGHTKTSGRGFNHKRIMKSGDREACRLLGAMTPNCYRHLARTLSRSITAATEANIRSRLPNRRAAPQTPSIQSTAFSFSVEAISPVGDILSPGVNTISPVGDTISPIAFEEAEASKKWFNKQYPSSSFVSVDATTPIVKYAIYGRKGVASASWVQGRFKNFGYYLDNHRIYVLDRLADASDLAGRTRSQELSLIDECLRHNPSALSESNLPSVNGLVVLIIGNRCHIRVFGNSPISAMILRPVGNIYEPIAFSNPAKPVGKEIFTGDLIVVGKSALIYGDIREGRNFAVGQDTKAIARSIFRPEEPKSSLVIVGKIELRIGRRKR
jgi:hypothetical protein